MQHIELTQKKNLNLVPNQRCVFIQIIIIDKHSLSEQITHQQFHLWQYCAHIHRIMKTQLCELLHLSCRIPQNPQLSVSCCCCPSLHNGYKLFWTSPVTAPLICLSYLAYICVVYVFRHEITQSQGRMSERLWTLMPASKSLQRKICIIKYSNVWGKKTLS